MEGCSTFDLGFPHEKGREKYLAPLITLNTQAQFWNTMPVGCH
jgi:hypothetical protein